MPSHGFHVQQLPLVVSFTLHGSIVPTGACGAGQAR